MRSFVLLILIFLGQFAFGQGRTIKKDEQLFEKAFLMQQLVHEDLGLDDVIKADSIKAVQELATEIKETILYKAIDYYQELIDSFPESKLLFRALNNKGFIELALKDTGDGKLTFLKILNSKADDQEPGGIGSGIMAEPYANYKNRAIKVLADISIQEGNFMEAIKYLDLTNKYPYRHFCGNEYAADDIYMTELYAKSYLGLKNKQKALEVLLPAILENGLADNSDLVKLAYKTLMEEYSKDELQTKYEEAFKNNKVEKVKTKKEECNRYYITFLNIKIVLNSWKLAYLEPGNEQTVINEIYKNSPLYKLLTGQE